MFSRSPDWVGSLKSASARLALRALVGDMNLHLFIFLLLPNISVFPYELVHSSNMSIMGKPMGRWTWMDRYTWVNQG